MIGYSNKANCLPMYKRDQEKINEAGACGVVIREERMRRSDGGRTRTVICESVERHAI